MAHRRGLVILGLGLVAAIIAAALISVGVPLASMVPPVSTVLLIVAIPIVVVGGTSVLSVLARAGNPPSALDQRRAAAAFAPRPRRMAWASGSSLPAERDSFAASLELPDRLAN